MNTDETRALAASPEHAPPTALAPITPTQSLARRSNLMPAVTVEEAGERYRALIEFVSRLMKKDVDYGLIPGTGDKLTLLKPGAEKLCNFFGLSVRLRRLEAVEDWTGASHNGEPFFSYTYTCELWRGDMLVAVSDASCNSWEKKYRYRQGQVKCPDCSMATIFRSKQNPEFYCWRKKGGCGATFPLDDKRITSQDTERVPNPEIFDQVNTLQKMAEKRALIGSTLIAVNASEFFTQDLEDINDWSPPPAQTDDREYHHEVEHEAPPPRVSLRTVEAREREAVALVNASAVVKEGDRYRVQASEDVFFYVTRDDGGKVRCDCAEYELGQSVDARFRCPHIIAVRLWTETTKQPPKAAPPTPTEPEWKCSAETRARLEAAIKEESQSGLKGAFTESAIVQAIRETWGVAELHELTDEQAVAAAERVEGHVVKLRANEAMKLTDSPASTSRKTNTSPGSSKSRAGGSGK